MSDPTTPDEAFMLEALAEARLAAAAGDVPVGSVVVLDNRIVARGRNRREALDDPTAHAEVEAIREAARGGHGSGWRLVGATVYATLEPCPMCAGALVNARVQRVVYGCPDPKAGAIDTLFSVGTDPRLNHRFEVARGVLGEACAAELKAFFAARRRPRKG
jgi:tRNA(adenine34) deaminase